MSLYDTKEDCLEYASKLPINYTKYDIDMLANKYCEACDNQDKENQNIYLSALLLRFWNKIDKIYSSTKNLGYDRDDAFARLYECIHVACQYRSWQNPEKNTNAQACINQTIISRGAPAMVYEANLQKNFRPECLLDNPIDGEDGDTFGDLIASDTTVEIDYAQDMIQTLIKNNKVVEAIIADNIAYNEVFKYTVQTKKSVDEDGNEVKYKDVTSEFWSFKLIQQLNTLDEQYIKYFAKTYKIKLEILSKAMDALKSANNQKKYKMISAFQNYARNLFQIN